jgi:hypothetical protein
MVGQEVATIHPNQDIATCLLGPSAPVTARLKNCQGEEQTHPQLNEIFHHSMLIEFSRLIALVQM